MATTDNLALRYFVESTYGEVPSPAPTLQTLLVRSESLTTNFDTLESEAVTGERQLVNLVRTGRLCEGTIETELNYSNLDDLFRGALAANWNTDTLENASTLISFGFEKHLTTLGIFYAFAGGRINSLAVTMEPRSMIRASVGVMAKGGVFSGASVGDGTPDAVTANEPMVTLSTLTLQEAGAAIACPTRFSFETTNELKPKICMGEDDISGINLGNFRVTGTLEAYFESTTYVNKLINDTATDFVITATDADGNSYTFTFPKVKFSTLEGPANTGRNQDVLQTLGWTAYRDPSTEITMRIERSAA